ncbi:hypothetical protein [Mycobacterium sp.]|uniref:hypothetical protein n=1 Tax=Mycobacterium sp. TaxID=1785 RepID=UPI002C63BF69|nr:hypothetical protein [Mycobacterium sp.]HKP44260.1 hypothetical protein [Mycobacterium sp.]
MTVTTLHARTGIPFVGGYGPANAAKEALTRDQSDMASGMTGSTVNLTMGSLDD